MGSYLFFQGVTSNTGSAPLKIYENQNNDIFSSFYDISQLFTGCSLKTEEKGFIVRITFNALHMYKLLRIIDQIEVQYILDYPVSLGRRF